MMVHLCDNKPKNVSLYKCDAVIVLFDFSCYQTKVDAYFFLNYIIVSCYIVNYSLTSNCPVRKNRLCLNNYCPKSLADSRLIQ